MIKTIVAVLVLLTAAGYSEERIPDGFVKVEAGTTPGDYVTIKEDFYIGKYEVTNAQVARVFQWAYDKGKVNASSSTVTNAQGDSQELLNLDGRGSQISFSDGTFSVDDGKGNYPCVEISWFGAAAYCNFLSESQGLTPAYNMTDASGGNYRCSDWTLADGANGYRLPSYMQWEYAARGGRAGKDTEYSGSDTIADVAWYRDNSNAAGNSGFMDGKGTLPVGGKAANELGTYDMSGNVWEWCHDWYPGEGGSYRVQRGGSWYYYARICRVARRFRLRPENSNYLGGFRPVLPAGQ